MTHAKHTSTLFLFLIISLILTLNTQTCADSVYAIPDHWGATLNVYDILEGSEAGQLKYRAF